MVCSRVSEKNFLEFRPGNPRTGHRRADYPHGAQHRGFNDPALANPVHVHADNEGDGDRAEDGKRAPRAPGDRLHGFGGDDPTFRHRIEFGRRQPRRGHQESFGDLARGGVIWAVMIDRVGRDLENRPGPVEVASEAGGRRVSKRGPLGHRHALAAQGLDDHDAQSGQRDDDHVQDGDRRGRAGDRPKLLAGDLGQALAAATGGGRQDHHVLHGTGEAHAHHEPDQPRQVAELDGKDGADQRSGARDGGEVVAEQDPAVRGLVILAVFEGVGGGHAESSSAATFAARKAL